MVRKTSYNMYRWKDTIGPIEMRREQFNIWNYHQSVGLGYFEYFQFCEDIGAKAVPVVPAGVCCPNTGARYNGLWEQGQCGIPIEDMPNYVQEVLDLIEWANGPITSTWGAKRAEAGHPEPFGLEYLGVGICHAHGSNAGNSHGNSIARSKQICAFKDWS